MKSIAHYMLEMSLVWLNRLLAYTVFKHQNFVKFFTLDVGKHLAR